MTTENNNKVILYFEDESPKRECMKKELENAGYFVLDFGNTVDASEYAENWGNKIDGAIIDRHMDSDFSRDDLIDKIFYKMQIRNKSIPIISVSGWPNKPKNSTTHFHKSVENKVIIQKLNELIKMQ